MVFRIENITRPRGARTAPKRVGRGIGSGLGKTSGRGHKGAKARSGSGGLGPGFEGGQMPLIRRIPKRGFTNKFKERWNVLNINRLERANFIQEGQVIDKGFLIEHGLLKRKRLPLKILGKGKITKAITVKADAFSRTASELIKEAGGKIELIKK